MSNLYILQLSTILARSNLKMSACYPVNSFRPNEHPATTNPPPCLVCGCDTISDQVAVGNLNGNGGRPYFKCRKCGEFACFRDMRGVHPENPPCECPEKYASCIQVAGKDKSNVFPRGVHFTCAVGRCQFFQWGLEANGEVMILRDNLPGPREMERMGF